MNWSLYLSDMAPYLATAVVLIALVVVVNEHGHKLGRHDEWLAVLELRIANLHKDREAARVRSLQVPKPAPGTPRPPPLSQNRTIEVDDSWILTKDTSRYPKKEREE